MAILFADRVKETSTTTGTGSFTLAGAVTGFRAFSSVLSTGSTNTTVYVIANDTANEWEIGLGYLSAATTLVRDAVFINSSNTTLKLNFSAGTKNVFITQPAKWGQNNHILSWNVNGTPESQSNVTSFGYITTIGGNGATAVGSSATANALNTTALGIATNASGTYSTAVGASATASGANSSAFGQGSSASSTNATALGDNATASGSSSTAVGKTTSATGPYSTAVGASASATTDYATAVGYGASVGTSSYGTAVGQYSNVTGNNAIAFGGGNTSSGNQSIAIGTSNNVSGYNSIAIGYSSMASGTNAIALGSNLNANQTEQFLTYMRVNPSGLSGVSVKYDSTAREIYAETGGGGGGVTQIIAGTGITISPPTGTGIVTINAGSGPTGFDWFTRDPSPVDGSISPPTNFTASPSGPAYFVVAGFVNVPFSPSGLWNPGSTGGWFGQQYYSFGYNWYSISSPYTYAGGASSGVAFNYVQYPGGHSLTNYQNIWGSPSNWNGGYGGSFGVFSPPSGSSKQLYCVFVVDAGVDVSGTVSANPSYPGTQVDAYYDSYSGATVVSVQNTVDSEVSSILNTGTPFVAWGGSYSYYGNTWYEYN